MRAVTPLLLEVMTKLFKNLNKYLQNFSGAPVLFLFTFLATPPLTVFLLNQKTSIRLTKKNFLRKNFTYITNTLFINTASSLWKTPSAKMPFLIFLKLTNKKEFILLPTTSPPPIPVVSKWLLTPPLPTL